MIEVKLHDIGEGMTEAEISCFFAKPGDHVKADDPLVEVQTDKMTAEIPAPQGGIIKELFVEPGQTVSVGTTILIIDDADAATQNHTLIEKDIRQYPQQGTPSNSNNKWRIIATPYTRKIARDHNIDIELIQGTGPSGRILDEDIYQYIRSQKEQTKFSLKEEVNEMVESETVSNPQESIPFRGRRKQIAGKMIHSLQTIPHCTHFEEVDVTELIKFRNELKIKQRNISATAFFLKALSVSLKDFPIFNSRLDEEKEAIILERNHHFGIAVDTKEGLIVPVLRDVELKSIQTIHREMKELTKKALSDQLTIRDITGGSFTISNVGPLGGSIGATPIILHPQVGLMSFHKQKKMPVVTDDDQIVIRTIMNISMSFDHRVADGATAVSFTNRFRELIQDPKLLLLELI